MITLLLAWRPRPVTLRGSQQVSYLVVSTLCGTTQVKYIGYYETEEGAAHAYDKAVVQTRGSAAQVREICS